MATLTTKTYTATRLTIHSHKTFTQVTEKLYSSIGSPLQTTEWQKVAKSITSYSEASKKQFEEQIEALVGPHGFMIFQVAHVHSFLSFFYCYGER
jgi:hypothetical protein